MSASAKRKDRTQPAGTGQADGGTGSIASAADIAALRALRDGMDAEQVNASVTVLGRELARTETGAAVSRMIADSGLSLQQIKDKAGFDRGALSRWANGVPESGAALASVMALAEALGYRVHLTVEKK